MRKLPLVPLPLLLTLLAGGCQPPAEEVAPARTGEQVTADMEALRIQWQDAANADDDAGVANTYTEDAYYVDPYGGIHEGRAAIAAYFEQGLLPISAYDIQMAGSVGEGNVVAAYGTWSMTLTGPTGDAAVNGHWQTVGVYQADGSLKIRLHHTMVPAPPPTATPAQ